MNTFKYLKLINDSENEEQVYDVVELITGSSVVIPEILKMNDKHLETLEAIGESKVANELKKDYPHLFSE